MSAVAPAERSGRSLRSRLIAAAALPLVVIGLHYLLRVADPEVRGLCGAALGPLIESLDVSVTINVYLMLILYLPALLESIPGARPSRAWRLIAGIDIGWFGTLMVFSGLTWVYGTLDRDVLKDSPVLATERLFYLALLLCGSTFHIATALHTWLGWRRTIAVWSLGVVAVVAVLTVAGDHGYAFPFSWLPPAPVATGP